MAVKRKGDAMIKTMKSLLRNWWMTCLWLFLVGYGFVGMVRYGYTGYVGSCEPATMWLPLQYLFTVGVLTVLTFGLVIELQNFSERRQSK